MITLLILTIHLNTAGPLIAQAIIEVARTGNLQKVIVGPTVNPASQELLPEVSPDGKYLLMRSERNGVNGIYGVDTKIIMKLKPTS